MLRILSSSGHISTESQLSPHIINESSNQNQSTNLQYSPQCPHCGKLYSNASNLRQHVRNVHVTIDKALWHACLTCGKKLKTKHYLINHQLQAHGIHQRSGINTEKLDF